MDLSVRSSGPYVPEDHSWLGSAHGTEATKTITLDPDLFTEATHFPNGYLLSGTVLAEVTATPGVYGPYADGAADGRQTAKGFLFATVNMRAAGPNAGAALLEHGAIYTPNLPANHGLDAAARADLAAKFAFRP